MDTILLCQRLQKTTYLVFILLRSPGGPPELIGSGTAVAVNSRGDLLTAAHVVTTRLPIRDDDLHDPNLVILAKRLDNAFVPYHSPLCGVHVNLGELLLAPLTIDLAVLRPFEAQRDIEFLPIRDSALVVGEAVLMAGYPDDIELPFSFDQLLPASSVEVMEQRVNLDIAKRLLMVRSGIVGHSSGVRITDPTSGTELVGQYFHVDNVLHSGASGGPIVDSDGQLVGILTKRSITRVPYEETPGLRVPSGAAVAITPRILLPQLRALGVIAGGV